MAILTTLLVACASSESLGTQGVGDECDPTREPTLRMGGMTLIEYDHEQCETGICWAHEPLKYVTASLEECLEAGIVSPDTCQRDYYPEIELRHRVFCTCHCDEDTFGAVYETCECGAGFHCEGAGYSAFCIRDGLERHE